MEEEYCSRFPKEKRGVKSGPCDVTLTLSLSWSLLFPAEPAGRRPGPSTGPGGL